MNGVQELEWLRMPVLEMPLPLQICVLGWSCAVGLAIGSFLNVVISRLPQGISIVRPRSRCPACESQIAWYDNLPVLSWLILRGRCRGCSAAISWRYPFIELLGGAVALALVLRWGLSFGTLELLIFAFGLMALSFIDLDTFEVPLEILAVLALNGVFFGAVGAFLESPGAWPLWLHDIAAPQVLDGLVSRIVGLVAGFVSLAAVNVLFTYWFRLRGKLEGDQWAMGWGDPLLLGAMGCTLGWHAIPLVVFLSSVQGAFIGLILQATGKMPAESYIEAREDGGAQKIDEEDWVPPPTALPFVPFLALAGLEVAFFGDVLLRFLGDIM